MNKLYVADDGVDDTPFMVVYGYGITRSMFTKMVRAQLDAESLPNPDKHVSRLTLTEWNSLGDFIRDWAGSQEGEGEDYIDLTWTYPGVWIELEVGAPEPIPEEYLRDRQRQEAEELMREAYEPSDPKHPDFYDWAVGGL